MFPTKFYDAEKITKIGTGDLFGVRYKEFTPADSISPTNFVVKEELTPVGYKSITFNSCDKFRSNAASEITRIFGLTQPFSTELTKPIIVYIFDSAGNKNAELLQGAVFQPQQGNL